MRIALLGLAAAAAAGLAGCGHRDVAAAPADPGFNVLIVVVDAMRADRLGCAGYDRDTTPAIDRLARDPDAVRFARHYVQGAYTKSSTASLFTGLYVFQHGVIMGHDLRESTRRPGLYPVQVLADEHDTMAERLRVLGWRTFGVVKSWHLDASYGFAQGFDDYVGPDTVRSDVKRVAATLDLAGRGGAFFGYLHLSGPHHPFPPPRRHPDIIQRYGLDAGFRYDELDRIAAGVDFTKPDIQHAILDGRTKLEPDDVTFLNLVYDAELRTADGDVGALLDGLRASGRYDDTLIIVTADHGEELYDHQGYGHGHALWDEVVHVPLIVKFPRGMRPDALSDVTVEATQAIDLLPSLLAFAGDTPPASLPGTAIFDHSPRDLAYAETLDEWTLVRGHDKLVDGGDRPRLYDLAADPGEHDNLAASSRAMLTAMRETAAALRQHVAVRPGAAPVIEDQLSEEAVRALRSLGYVR